MVHKLPEDTTAHTLRGTWWKPTPSSDYVLVLGNTSLSAKRIQIQVSDHLGHAPVKQSILLPSHHSSLLHLSDLLAGSGINGGVGNIALSYSAPGSVSSPTQALKTQPSATP